MAVIAFISPKGGAGKTTAAATLALGLAARGERVAIIDADLNRPLVQWVGRGQPGEITAHPAPTNDDVRDALREAKRREPKHIIVDTEGSLRGAMAFRGARPNLVLTPLTLSELEVAEALKAADLVAEAGKLGGAAIRHRALLSRIPTAVRPAELKPVLDRLRDGGLDPLPVPLLEDAAFRALFSQGGGFAAVRASGLDTAAAEANAAAYVRAVMALAGA